VCSSFKIFSFSWNIFGGFKKSRLLQLLAMLIELASCLCLLGLLGQKNSLDVGENSTLSDGDTREKFVQLLVVADGELQVTWDNSRLLVVTSGVSCQLKHLSSEIFHHCGEIHWSTSTDAFSVVSLAKETVDTTDWELKSSTV